MKKLKKYTKEQHIKVNDTLILIMANYVNIQLNTLSLDYFIVTDTSQFKNKKQMVNDFKDYFKQNIQLIKTDLIKAAEPVLNDNSKVDELIKSYDKNIFKPQMAIYLREFDKSMTAISKKANKKNL